MCSLGVRQRGGRYGGEELVQGQKDKHRTRIVEVLFERKCYFVRLQRWSCMKVGGKKQSTHVGGLNSGYFLWSFTLSRALFKHNGASGLEVRQKTQSPMFRLPLKRHFAFLRRGVTRWAHQFKLLPVRLGEKKKSQLNYLPRPIRLCALCLYTQQ